MSGIGKILFTRLREFQRQILRLSVSQSSEVLTLVEKATGLEGGGKL